MRRGKLILLTAVLFTLALFSATAGGVQEQGTAIPAGPAADQANRVVMQAEPIDISVAALKGPSGFAAAGMIKDNFQPGDGVTADYLLLASPLEAVTKMTSGEVDAAFLPVNTAAKLYNGGLGYKLAAVSGVGSLYMQTTDPSVKTWADLKGKTVYLTGKGATPDYLLRYLLIDAGLDPDNDLTLNFTAAPTQIIQLIAAGKADTAFIPQPFAMLAEVKTGAKIVLDPQQDLMKARGTSKPYPFTAFVISERLINEHPAAAAALTAALADSIEWVTGNTADAAAAIEEIGIMTADIAKPAIPLCGVEFIPAADSEADVQDFLQMLLELDPVSVGGKLPDEGFFYKN